MSNESVRNTVRGSVLPGYEGVRRAFEDNLVSGEDIGAAFAVYRGGEPVVDLWGGYHAGADAAAITDTTLFGVNSTTKGITAICIAMLVDKGKLDYDAPVSRYWPEFAANGKSEITVGEMMSHQAGLVATRDPVTLEDYIAHEGVASMLAAQEPFFLPGEWGYHPLTYGTLADELMRRVDGRTIARFYKEEVASKLDIDVFMGLPAEEDHRYAAMVGEHDSATLFFDVPDLESMTAAMTNPMVMWDFPNQRSWREAGHPGAAATASARGLAKLYAHLFNDDPKIAPLLSPSALQQATRERIAGVDRCSGGTARYAAGFRLNVGTMGSNPASFGHLGYGGSVAFGDPARRWGVAYTPNRLVNPDWQSTDPRLAALLMALYRAEQSN